MMSVNDPELKNPENTAVPSSEEIEQQLEDIENSGKSKWRPYTMKIATVLAIVLAIAHLANAAFAGFLISYELRAMHLGGILVLTFLLYPARKKWMMSKLNFAIDILLMGGAAFSCGHLFAISRNLNKHVGNGLLIDTVCGIILFVCLIEATRRVMGWIVPTLVKPEDALLYQGHKGISHFHTDLPATMFYRTCKDLCDSLKKYE